MSAFSQPISEQIWDKKYRFKTITGEPLDHTLNDTWDRVATALAAAESEAERGKYKALFVDVMKSGEFSPAGRIIAGAGSGRSVTLSNCLAGDTMLLTGDRGLVPIGQVAGETVTVMDGNGQWVQAVVNSFGERAVRAVNLRGGYNGRTRKTIRATENHRWIMRDGSEKTTEGLCPGDVLKVVKRRDVSNSASYQEGLVHGLVYGDGSQRPKGETYLRLCGAKREFLTHFEGQPGWSVKWHDGEPHLYLSRDLGGMLKLKCLPQKRNVKYMTGFLRGWLATDGCVNRGKALLSCGEDESEWLRRFGPICGMEVSSVVRLSDTTNFGERNKALFNVHFHRWTMIPEDFLLAKHREGFAEADYSWVVDSIGDLEEAEPVFCPRVFSTDSVQLDLGIHTGQCFTMGTIPDSMEGIFQNLKEAALTMQQGGGIGYDFSTLRPKGAPVRGVAADASGPLSFMDVWDSMCRTIMSAGSRRGAMMATMRCDHPDIEAFIEAKSDPARLRMFNVSVLVTDEFMGAVKHGHNWRLHFEDRHGVTIMEKIVDARELWNKIMRSTYDYAEPGVIFIDRVNRDHNLSYLETIATTNPCGEKPMGPYASCLLGSINLAKLVSMAFSVQARIDEYRLHNTVAAAIRMMDNVIEVGNFPLPEQKTKAVQDRQLGLGVTGLADALIMCGLVYGSPEAVRWTEKVMKAIAICAYDTSVKIAKEKGAFPTLVPEKFLNQDHFAGRMLPPNLKDKIRKHGIRNGLLLSIAPTGTISLLAGNVSSGIEPVFAPSYMRKVLQPDGTKTEERVLDYALHVWEGLGNEGLPPAYTDAQTLDPMAHVRMQAAAQKWVDSSISKTINVPEDISFDAFKDVYMTAWDEGCKGCTTYRPNPVTGSVLSVDPKPAEPQPTATPEKPVLLAPAPRPDVLEGRVYKMKWPASAHSIYVTITDILEDGQRRPFEVFVNSKDPSHFAWTVGLTRMISAIFRRPHDSRFVVEELKAVFDPKGGAWVNGQYVPSILAALGHVIERHMKTIGYIESDEELTKDDTEAVIEAVAAPGATCPSCGSYNVVSQSGCLVCKDCGHSNCG